MNLNGQDYVFHKAHGEADWWKEILQLAATKLTD